MSKREMNIEEMLRANLHFGHRTTRLHPNMEPYIYGTQSTTHIIDLEKTAEKLDEALKFIQQIVSQGKTILLVSTQPHVRHLVKEMAQDCGIPYMNERWIGGTFTNFEVVRKRVDYFQELEKKIVPEVFRKYTSHQRSIIYRDFQRLQKECEGLKTLTSLPLTVLILDIRKDKLAVKEARSKGVIVIGVCDTNTDPSLVDYPIPANDDAISSVQYVLEKVKEVILAAFNIEHKRPSD